MIVLLAVAAWGLVALAAGLVMGEPFLRTGGVLVLCLSVGAAFLLDRLTPRGDLWLEESEWGDECGDVEFFWPNDERRAA